MVILSLDTRLKPLELTSVDISPKVVGAGRRSNSHGGYTPHAYAEAWEDFTPDWEHQPRRRLGHAKTVASPGTPSADAESDEASKHHSHGRSGSDTDDREAGSDCPGGAAREWPEDAQDLESPCTGVDGQPRSGGGEPLHEVLMRLAAVPQLGAVGSVSAEGPRAVEAKMLEEEEEEEEEGRPCALISKAVGKESFAGHHRESWAEAEEEEGEDDGQACLQPGGCAGWAQPGSHRWGAPERRLKEVVQEESEAWLSAAVPSDAEGGALPGQPCADSSPVRRLAPTAAGTKAELRVLTPTDSPTSPCDAPLKPGAKGHFGPEVTTAMIRNLPHNITQHDLLNEINRCGFAGHYDFAYMPGCFRNGQGHGFAFVNFTSPDAATSFAEAWHKTRRLGIRPSDQQLNISPADVQGLEANLAKWSGPRMGRIRNPNLRPFTTAAAASPQAGAPAAATTAGSAWPQQGVRSSAQGGRRYRGQAARPQHWAQRQYG